MTNFATPRAAGSRAKFALLLMAGGLGCAMAAGAATAAPTDKDVRTLVVHYSDQNLATDSGVHALYRRLVKASIEVCPTVGTTLVNSTVRDCRQQAIARAVEQINNPHLAALYATNTKRG